MAVDGRLDFIEKEMCVLLGSRATFATWNTDSFGAYRKRIETQIAEIQEKSEKKKMEVWNDQIIHRRAWDRLVAAFVDIVLTSGFRSLHSNRNCNSSRPVLPLLKRPPDTEIFPACGLRRVMNPGGSPRRVFYLAPYR